MSYETLFELAPAATAVIECSEAGASIGRVNEAFLALVGRPRPRVEGRLVAEVIPAVAGDQVAGGIERCLTDQSEVRLRIALARGDELVRLRVHLRRVELGGQAHLIMTLTPRDEAVGLASLGESGVLAEIGPLSRGLVYIHDATSRVLRYGRHPLVNRLGLPKRPVELSVVRDRVHPEDLERWRTYADAQLVAPDDRVSKATFRLRGAEDEWLWVNIRSRVFARDGEGKVTRVIGVATDLTEEYNHAQALTLAASSLARAELQERRKIGRELHDSTAQLLAAARLSLGVLERHMQPSGPARQALDDVRDAVAGAQTEIRNFSYMLHPPSLQDQGLERALRGYAAGFARRTGLDISVTVSRGQWRIAFPIQVALFRVAQEALMNVVRHAHAGKAWVRLRRLGNEIVLEVEDDGIGMSALGRDAILAGVGVSGMKARMLQLNGDLELLAGRKGLRVRARVAELVRPGD